MNNLAPMKNCPGGVQGNLNWMPGYSKCFIEEFLLQRTGSIFDALIQPTDGCTEFLWLLVQPHHSIHCSYKRYINRHLSQHMIFQYQDKDSGEPMQMYRLARAFSA